MIAKLKHNKKSKLHSYLSISILIHLTIIGGLLWGAFFTERTMVMEGSESIKAVMIDLSVMAAPEQSLVEDSPAIDKVDNHEVDKEVIAETNPEENKIKPEVAPDLIVEKEQAEKLPIPKEPQLVIKQKPVKPKEKYSKKPPAKQASSPQTRQEIKADKLADQAVAPAISNNTQFSATPTAISRNHPQYPRKALDLRIEGYVIVIYDIGTNGRVENVRIAEAKPNNIFNKAVIQAMKQWKYQPIAAKNLTIKIVFNRNKLVALDKV